ncbi:hypothetical protein Tcan_05592 [Toxocara canis]|uniref:Uncharacterized protein n=1 Tax=Toxocara canis TaxID=6265 RepID=A0A0B2VJC4_TOXCA|nr:hypothetical protein Tcan_05592 [Toxocara canis]
MSAQLAGDGGPAFFGSKVPALVVDPPAAVLTFGDGICTVMLINVSAIRLAFKCVCRTTTATDSDPSVASLRPLRRHLSRLLICLDQLALVDLLHRIFIKRFQKVPKIFVVCDL